MGYMFHYFFYTCMSQLWWSILGNEPIGCTKKNKHPPILFSSMSVQNWQHSPHGGGKHPFKLILRFCLARMGIPFGGSRERFSFMYLKTFLLNSIFCFIKAGKKSSVPERAARTWVLSIWKVIPYQLRRLDQQPGCNSSGHISKTGSLKANLQKQ